ncbi:hypothetical protein C8R43DRAFT_1132899 [Mycena crocata]|nr:hypothetical protein C8R43DRAFT_1132899 [Mycena crocata]
MRFIKTVDANKLHAPNALESWAFSLSQAMSVSASSLWGVEKINTPALARAFAQRETKLLLALQWCTKNGHSIHDVVVSGGFASNALLRQRWVSSVDPIQLHFPEPALCTDNAVMIAWASMHRFLAGDHDGDEILPVPKWSLEDLQNPPPPGNVRIHRIDIIYNLI